MSEADTIGAFVLGAVLLLGGLGLGIALADGVRLIARVLRYRLLRYLSRRRLDKLFEKGKL